MRFLKILLKILGGLVALIAVVLVCMLTTIDDTPYQEMPYYQQWKTQMKELPVRKQPSGVNQLKAGWAKVNFTPKSPTPTAGYGVRRGALYTSVHDSIYVRAVVIENGDTKAAIVAADLLIIPPAVTEQLKEKLKATGIPFEQVYFGATHSHNSMGGWSEGIVGKLFGGEFNEANVTWIADAMVKAVTLAQKDLQPATVAYNQLADTARVRNRAFDEGTIDPFVRTMQFVRNDGQKALLCSYAAHSTIMSSDNIVLSRDYPGVLVDSLEKGEANFALFMSGAVGSMGPKIGVESDSDFVKVGTEADSLESDVQKQLTQIQPFPNPAFQMVTLPLPLRQPVPRVTTGLSMRPWVFHWAFGDYPNYVKAMRIGNVLMVGFPCDFSGELVAEMSAYAEKKGLQLMVTSFNGGYIGYITPDKYYGRDTYETLTMNWFGPYNGAYFQEIVRDLVDKMSA
ncbi:neutral/alkaline non-lysosomal ceramidase N-terminal domain-containing protein [Runella salmonicolor]|uniref:Neutral/alkaline non-lysosomal ceramidase N-terminal domain-containing protein n=1 Tax=Runella salmonicolor TaxID=2950278 RepID=A0ABT1FQA8_9BACT|nr:neutral/alkaline non-lysosomal ceramidase N-terminal domain-containing protein [Runella salmonicolor]MCP1383950.1 neutral/alkaline non-lysosomal ceramidase N-terminal domain-containing protein [Runella salmonicolor]